MTNKLQYEVKRNRKLISSTMAKTCNAICKYFKFILRFSLLPFYVSEILAINNRNAGTIFMVQHNVNYTEVFIC